MTAQQIADVLHARRTGDARWIARCPAHADRRPSLSIREGRAGRVLLRCFAGCETADVLHTLGLRWADICGSPMTPEQAQKAAVERQARELRQHWQRAVERASFDRLRELHAITDELGIRLANDPDGPDADAVAQLFHEALNKIRQTEAMVTR
ncbi:MAG: hypothetical protein WCB58_18365 [Acidobacteriaceae bacterium]